MIAGNCTNRNKQLLKAILPKSLLWFKTNICIL